MFGIEGSLLDACLSSPGIHSSYGMQERALTGIENTHLSPLLLPDPVTSLASNQFFSYFFFWESQIMEEVSH
jgi:hypothetical protein